MFIWVGIGVLVHGHGRLVWMAACWRLDWMGSGVREVSICCSRSFCALFVSVILMEQYTSYIAIIAHQAMYPTVQDCSAAQRMLRGGAATPQPRPR
jgi:hypothetical protein